MWCAPSPRGAPPAARGGTALRPRANDVAHGLSPLLPRNETQHSNPRFLRTCRRPRPPRGVSASVFSFNPPHDIVQYIQSVRVTNCSRSCSPQGQEWGGCLVNSRILILVIICKLSETKQSPLWKGDNIDEAQEEPCFRLRAPLKFFSYFEPTWNNPVQTNPTGTWARITENRLVLPQANGFRKIWIPVFTGLLYSIVSSFPKPSSALRLSVCHEQRSSSYGYRRIRWELRLLMKC